MFYAAVLAGGRSSRMGRDKGRLQLEGRTLLERAIEVLRQAGAERVLISGEVDGHASVPDLLPACGPPGGLYSLLDYLRASYGLDGTPLVLIPVDMPLLTPAAVSDLVQAAINAPAAHYEGEVFPCVLRATPDLYMHLRALFSEGTELGGRRSMQALLNFTGAKVISQAGRAADEFRNVNTPEDWQAVTGAAVARGAEGGLS